MFGSNTLIRLGNLTEVLDGKGITAVPLLWNKVEERYLLDMEIVPVTTTIPLLQEHTGWIVPTLSAFDASVLESLQGTTWKLRKVLLAVSKQDVISPTIDISSTHDPISELFASRRTIFRGCAQLIPLSDTEKLLCRIRGVTFEPI